MNISKIFIQSIPKRRQQILAFAVEARQSNAPKPWIQLKRLFHSLKTSASMAGFYDLAQLAANAEYLADHKVGIDVIYEIGNLLEKGAGQPVFFSTAHPSFQKITDRLNQIPSDTDNGDLP